MTDQKNNQQWGVDDITNLFAYVDNTTLETIRTKLRTEVDRLQRSVAFLDSRLDGSSGVDLVEPKTSQGTNPSPSGDNKASQQKSTGSNTDRNVIKEREKFLRQQNLNADGWLYRTHYRQALLAGKFANEGKNFDEIVRQILRHARDKKVLIERTVYSITKLGVVQATYMFGLPEFNELENKEKYDQKLVASVRELGLYLTAQEAEDAKQAKKNANQLQLAG